MRSTFSPNELSRHVPSVGLFQEANTRILAQFEIHLPVAGIDRDHTAAPCCSRQSVNPPVEAPTSRQTLPSTSICQCSRARSSLSPPRLTYFRSSPSSRIDGVRFDLRARFFELLVVDQHFPRENESLGAFARGSQSAVDQKFVESEFQG